MKTYEIPRCDGRPFWDEIPVLEVSEVQWLPECGIRMIQQICYDDGGFHVHQRAWEKNVRAEVKDPLGPVCEDSCMEFFLAPYGDGRYFNVECNPAGTVYFGFGAGRGSRFRLIAEDIGALLSLETKYCDGGWEVTYDLPLSVIRLFFPEFTMTPGRRFTANCYKCGDKTVTPHYLAWNPLTSAAPDFHRPDDFGRMVLAAL